MMDPNILPLLVKTRMPFGKYKDTILCDIPSYYLEWMARDKAFPKGKLGMLLQTMYEIRLNGLEDLLRPLR